MKRLLPHLPLLAVCATLGLSMARAGTEQASDSITPPVVEKSSIPISQEFNAEGSYSGGALTKQGSKPLGDLDNINSHFDYVISPQVKDGVLLRFGIDSERNSFGLPNKSPLPNTLQSANLIIGADLALTDKILFRIELHPGYYGDNGDITSSDIDVPVQFGATYLYSKDLQIILGGQFDYKSDVPFIVVPGIRWQFADKWVLSAIPPKPQLQYELSNALTLYAGAEILAGTYELNDQFGSAHSDVTIGGEGGNLNGKIMDFTEVRLGVGTTWKFMPNLSLDVSGGYIAYREFAYSRRQVRLRRNRDDVPQQPQQWGAVCGDGDFGLVLRFQRRSAADSPAQSSSCRERMDRPPSTLSDLLVAGLFLVALPLWLLGLWLLHRREVKARSPALKVMRLLRLPAVMAICSILPFKSYLLASLIGSVLVAAAIFYGCYQLESPAWTSQERRTFFLNQLAQVGLFLAFLALGFLVILIRFPNEPWS